MDDQRGPNPTAAMLSLHQVRKILDSQISPVDGYEQVTLKNCSGRVLFEDMFAAFDIPREAQSSMDGYAFHSDELKSGRASELAIAGTSWAGRPFGGSVRKRECVRIFTGADLPVGADSVALQENVRRLGDRVQIPPTTEAKQNIRMPGSEIQRGQRILEKGKRLSPADIGMLASLGIHELRVHRKPRVVFFSTGDELISLDKRLEAGKIYDSNRYLLDGMLRALGITALDFGAIQDNREAIRNALIEASAISDVIITTGGVSVGEADLVRNALVSTGHIEFWKIAIKPGKPLAFGRIGDACFFGLPGNPVSVFVTFYQIVRPALLRMMGTEPGNALRFKAISISRIKKTPGRLEFQRGRLKINENGRTLVHAAEKQESHNLSALGDCNCFIVLPGECDGVEAGQPVEVELIDPVFHFNDHRF